MGDLTHAAFGSAADQADDELFLAPPGIVPAAVPVEAPVSVQGPAAGQDPGQPIVDKLFRIAAASGARVLPLFGPDGETVDTDVGLIDDLPLAAAGPGEPK